MNTQNILDLFNNCIFDGELTEDNFWYKIVDQLPNACCFRFEHGASKMVIIPKGADYVIKIPFTGQEETTYDDYDDDYYQEFIDFNYSLYGDGWDYCLTEAVHYNKAKRKNIEKIFCKTRCIGKVSGHPIYIQERAEDYYSHRSKNAQSKSSRKSKTSKEIENICRENRFSQFNIKWQTDVYNYYGEKIFNRFMDFIKKECIQDLHSGNIGYLGARPVILDYSGWFE